jgi:hypothetical protein
MSTNAGIEILRLLYFLLEIMQIKDLVKMPSKLTQNSAG